MASIPATPPFDSPEQNVHVRAPEPLLRPSVYDVRCEGCRWASTRVESVSSAQAETTAMAIRMSVGLKSRTVRQVQVPNDRYGRARLVNDGLTDET